MSKSFVDNIKKARWTLAALFGAMYLQNRAFNNYMKEYHFGKDGISKFLYL